ncbi:hypothetical protein Nepgr_007062 [Nepenthes gracilis]|uniref:Uncharacterized protein n=1 Tax=Nepenthes gracilis TaxID=150966 RepID=A0AAD3S709_NEPGR|nr:hypothetical protein Nepgr_007062 [Nepenthes gracilis]
MADDGDFQQAVDHHEITTGQRTEMPMHESDFDDEDDNFIYINKFSSTCSTSEIEEVADENSGDHSGERLAPITEGIDSSVFSYDINSHRGDGGGDDLVYVVVEDRETSMDALLWTLKNAVNSSSTVIYLIHVFPEVKLIPSPLGNGKVPRSQVRADQVESYMAQERGKRRELLQRFIDKCMAYKVKVETILIESDSVHKAIAELLFVLNIRRLVIGVPKSNLRKLRSRKGNGLADQILLNAPAWCEVKCICEGKDVFDDQDMAINIGTQSQRHNSSSNDSDDKLYKSSNITISTTTAATTTIDQDEDQQLRDNSSNGSFAYCCFKPNVNK